MVVLNWQRMVCVWSGYFLWLGRLVEGCSWRGKIRVGGVGCWGGTKHHSFVCVSCSSHANLSAVLPVSPASIKKIKLVNFLNYLSTVMVNVWQIIATFLVLFTKLHFTSGSRICSYNFCYTCFCYLRVFLMTGIIIMSHLQYSRTRVADTLCVFMGPDNSLKLSLKPP